MNVLELTSLVWAGSLAAGFLGSLTGLGGGVVIVPLLTLVFSVDIRYAIGASLVSVIATSCGAAAAYVKEGYTNIRIAMFLEIATATGAIAGAVLATHIAPNWVAVIFGGVLMISAVLVNRRQHEPQAGESSNRVAQKLRLDGAYPGKSGPIPYHVQRIAPGFGMMFIAGTLSGLLGIGSGAFKVLAMDQIMRLPFKVSTTTSNFMIGVTAAASAGYYLNQGYIDPGLAMPVMLGVLPGAMLGTRLLARAQTHVLRAVFAIVIFALAIQMIWGGFKGRF